MIKKMFLSVLCLISCVAYAEKPAGFLWYNVPKLEHHKKQKGVSFKQLSYTDKDAVLKFYTMEALHKVRFTHRLEDEKVFLTLQDFWLKEATIHGQLNQKALLYYPEFDFSVTHPTSDLGSKLQDSINKLKQKKTIHALSKNHGLIFFYRAKNKLDQQQIPILKDFCKNHHFSLIPVSVDGVKAPLLPQSRIDRGQAEVLGVRYFPAILLVNPKTKMTVPVAFGLTTQDVLSRHLDMIAHGFQGEAI